MADLKLAVKLDKLSSDGQIGYIKDITGLYSANGTGYGIETYLKANLYFVIKVTTIETDGLIVSTTMGKTSSLTDYWEFVIPQDAAVSIEVKAVKVYDVARLSEYVEDQLLWKADTQELVIISDIGVSTATLTPITESETDITQYFARVVVYDVIQALTKKALVNLRIKTANACEEDIPVMTRQLIRLDNYLKAACDAISAGLRKEAARLMFEAVRMIHADKLISTPSSTC